MNNKDKEITVNLDINLLKDLELLSSEINKTKSDILEEALKMYKEKLLLNK